MKKSLWSAFVLAAFATPALAVNNEGTSGNYAVGAAAFEISDSARDADNGLGGQLTFGFPLQLTGGAVEISYYDVGRDRALDGRSDYQTSLLVNYVQDFGAFSIFKPFLTGGLGGVQEDVLGEKHTHFGLNAGFGTLIGLPWYGLAVRAEANALAHQNDQRSAPADKDILVDYRVMLGLQVPLMWASAAMASDSPAPVESCELSIVDPTTGRRDCAADSDRDGISDGVDQCPGTEPGAAVNEVGCPVVIAAPTPPPAAVAEPQPVYFATDVAVIDDASKAKLDEAAAYLAATPGTRIEITGHADNRGSEAYNIVLASQRAEAVRQYLLGKGVDAGRLTTLSMGEFNPRADNRTASGRALNRTAQFRIHGATPPVPVAAEPAAAVEAPSAAPVVAEPPVETAPEVSEAMPTEAAAPSSAPESSTEPTPVPPTTP